MGRGTNNQWKDGWTFIWIDGQKYRWPDSRIEQIQTPTNRKTDRQTDRMVNSGNEDIQKKNCCNNIHFSPATSYSHGHVD